MGPGSFDPSACVRLQLDALYLVLEMLCFFTVGLVNGSWEF
jgi:hypothetical protein